MNEHIKEWWLWYAGALLICFLSTQSEPLTSLLFAMLYGAIWRNAWLKKEIEDTESVAKEKQITELQNSVMKEFPNWRAYIKHCADKDKRYCKWLETLSHLSKKERESEIERIYHHRLRVDIEFSGISRTTNSEIGHELKENLMRT